MNMLASLQEAADHITSRCGIRPQTGVVLGSGLGNFTGDIQVEMSIPYQEIPHFPVSTVAGHQGRLILGHVAGHPIVAMAGRFHHYEGYSASDIVFPIRVMKLLGIQRLFLSNAAGGVNPDFRVGDLMVINDHISQFVPSPLVGPNIDALGTRFPDMSRPYSPDLIAKARNIAETEGLALKEGVYVCVSGPAYETPAEYRMVKAIGADAVGMSTVQEVTAAVHMGIPCFAVSVITDVAHVSEHQALSHEEVLVAAKAAEPRLTRLFRHLLVAS